jgi:hypothetical protein
MIKQRAWSRGHIACRIALTCGVVACSNDAQCLALPCPIPEAAEISVTASDAPTGIANLTAAVTGPTIGTLPCGEPAGPATLCRVTGGPGAYHVLLSAPGYKTTAVDFTVAGTNGGCNRCEQVDTRELAVQMQPAGA